MPRQLLQPAAARTRALGSPGGRRRKISRMRSSTSAGVERGAHRGGGGLVAMGSGVFCEGFGQQSAMGGVSWGDAAAEFLTERTT